MPETPLITNVAATLADGTPVDWERVQAGAGEREKRLIANLRLVAGVAHLYRTLPVPGGEVAEHAAVEPEGPRWGRLVVLERIGEGISSDVHRAWDLELHREVALKLLRDEWSDAGRGHDAHARVLREGRLLARIRHPHVVAVHGADRIDGRVGLWMELVRGESLEQIVKTRGPLGAREANVVGQDLCAALAAVHGAGLLHRDVKAQNVMRETGGRTVLMDFGTGEEQDRGTPRLVGTPMYLAPEIFLGQPASVRSDLYSLGVLLFYLVTGQFPLVASTMEELARAHMAGTCRRLRDLRPDLPDAFIRVVECSTARPPADRYESAGAMEVALRAALDPPAASQRSLQPQPQAAPPRGDARSGWWKRPAVAAAVVLSTVAAAFALIVWSRHPEARNGGAPPVASFHKIAVLPMADLSGGTAPPYLAEALTDQLIGTLGQVHALRITSRASVQQFKGQSTPIQDVARSLGVDAVLEGSLAVSAPDGGAQRVRVNARLIAAGTDTQIWSETFERPLGDLFALQAHLAREIAGAISALSPHETERLTQVRRTNPAAEEAYFQGRYHLNQVPSGSHAAGARGISAGCRPRRAARPRPRGGSACVRRSRVCRGDSAARGPGARACGSRGSARVGRRTGGRAPRACGSEVLLRLGLGRRGSRGTGGCSTCSPALPWRVPSTHVTSRQPAGSTTRSCRHARRRNSIRFRRKQYRRLA